VKKIFLHPPTEKHKSRIELASEYTGSPTKD